MILFCASSVQGNYSKGVLIGDWAIDQTEVTIQQFAEFVAVTGLTTRAEKEGGGFEFVGGWQRRSGWAWRSPEGQANADTRLPAVHLTHAEAEDYCRWRGGRLPTHIEWSSAGFTEQREFPPAPFIKGKTYKCTSRADSSWGQWPLRHRWKCVGVVCRSAWGGATNFGRLLVVRCIPNDFRRPSLEAGRLLCGLYWFSLRLCKLISLDFYCIRENAKAIATPKIR